MVCLLTAHWPIMLPLDQVTTFAVSAIMTMRAKITDRSPPVHVYATAPVSLCFSLVSPAQLVCRRDSPSGPPSVTDQPFSTRHNITVWFSWIMSNLINTSNQRSETTAKNSAANQPEKCILDHVTGPTICLVLALTWKRMDVEKPKLLRKMLWTFPKRGISSVPILTLKNQWSGLGTHSVAYSCRGWQYIMLTLGGHLHLLSEHQIWQMKHMQAAWDQTK